MEDFERMVARHRARERMACAKTVQEYQSARRDYLMECQLAAKPAGSIMWKLGSTLVGCWISITLVLWGGWAALSLIVNGDMLAGGCGGVVTTLFGAAWWSVNRYAVRTEQASI